jgi:hypothetical protein
MENYYDYCKYLCSVNFKRNKYKSLLFNIKYYLKVKFIYSKQLKNITEFLKNIK